MTSDWELEHEFYIDHGDSQERWKVHTNSHRSEKMIEHEHKVKGEWTVLGQKLVRETEVRQ